MPALLLALLLSAARAAPWTEDAPAALEAAKKKNTAVLLNFYAPWCYSCNYMAQHVLNAPEMDALAAKAELVMVDVDSSEGSLLRARYFARALPNYVVVNPQGEEIGRLIGEQPKASFVAELSTLLEKGSPLSELEKKARAGGPDAGAAASRALRAYVQRKTHAEGLALYASLPEPVQREVEGDAQGRLELLRLKVLSASADKNPDNCSRFGRLLLGGRSDCELMYDASWVYECFKDAPAPQMKKGLSFARQPIEALELRGLFGKPAERCADFATGVRAAAAFRAAWGEKKRADAALARGIELLKTELGGDLKRDRNKADSLLSLLKKAGRNAEVEALFPRLMEAYPKQYVYPLLHADFLLERGRAEAALAALDRAKTVAYGAGSLKIVRARAKTLAKLGRKDEALRELEAALKDPPKAFPDELAKLEKAKAELNP